MYFFLHLNNAKFNGVSYGRSPTQSYCYTISDEMLTNLTVLIFDVQLTFVDHLKIKPIQHINTGYNEEKFYSLNTQWFSSTL